MNKLLALGLLVALTWATRSIPARAVENNAVNQAVEKGVKALRDMQRADGTWPHPEIGATALAGLALLECGVGAEDRALRSAADAVRKACPTLTHTYSLALVILFLDRLGDPEDVPLLESLMVRLLAGQDARSGGWFYYCPSIPATETRRLQAIISNRKEGGGRRDEPREESKRKFSDLAPEIRDQLALLERSAKEGEGDPLGLGALTPQGARPFATGMGDNSNTQFAALALWVGRRHGLPIEAALTRLDRRFRTTQLEDGGWSYTPLMRLPGMGPGGPPMPGMGATATMTCAGLMALAITDGATLELAREQKRKEPLPDLNADKNLRLGLEALSSVIDNPRGLHPKAPGVFPPQMAADRVGGRTYYFLWSLERVAVALSLDTIGKKDWYGWGTEILLENQERFGAWNGDYADSGADTCFALLFLKRANLARDLTAQIKGKVQDPGERVLRGGVGFDKLRGKRKLKSGIETRQSRPLEKPLPETADSESGQLASRLLKEPAASQGDLLEQWESARGVKYTEALAAAIPKLEGPTQRKAREALANRLTRMKDDTLAEYLQDEDAEIRRGAALAVGQKESKSLVPNLITLLRDTELGVVRASHASLKALTGQDFGPAAKSTREERDQAVLKWIEWWGKQRRKSTRE